MERRSLCLLASTALLLAAACGGAPADPCSGVGCNGRGFCLADQGSAYCACIAGFHPAGLECLANDPADPCLGVDCSGHGACRVAAGQPVCDCAAGFRHPDPASPACTEGQCELLCLPLPSADGGAETDDGESPCVPGAPELCNGRDDDCDGLTDENFDRDFDALHCGACGRSCAAGDHAIPACVLGDCTVVCAPGWADLDQDPATGCEAVCEPGPATDETACDGRDDDCDGTTDEAWGTTDSCGTGFCLRSAVCFRGEVVCRPRAAPAETDATCDGVDDDCDGTTDEDCGGADADADVEVDAGPVCGNGAVEADEECDDGNRVPSDGCENDCRASCHSPADCDDFDQCTDNRCEPRGAGAASCAYPVADGSPCDDGDPCTDGERCDASGACTGGTSTCACAVTADCVPFEDGDACNGTLRCVSRACEVDPATVVSCSSTGDTDCRRNVCNPATGSCEYQPINEGLGCDDGLFCTTVDRCLRGACRGSGDPCPVAGCVFGCDEAGDRCQPAPFGFVCRPAAAPCDWLEACNGAGTVCPSDQPASAGTVCRPAAGDCDVAETCNGSSMSCPTDAFEPSSVVCEASEGVCDVAETCSGSGPDCPANAYRPSSYVCRAAGGSAICNPAERCTGSSPDCPADAWAPDDTICQSDGSLCGSAKDCHLCRSGSCVHNDGHWDGSCVPSCGTIRRYCGVEVDCCAASAVCTYGEPGGASYDCPKCCELSCCTPSESWEYSCWDGQDNDCDTQVDCDDGTCDGRFCADPDGYCEFGVCTM